MAGAWAYDGLTKTLAASTPASTLGWRQSNALQWQHSFSERVRNFLAHRRRQPPELPDEKALLSDALRVGTWNCLTLDVGPETVLGDA
eukprot:3095112-Amphidinium_carterae.1